MKSLLNEVKYVALDALDWKVNRRKYYCLLELALIDIDAPGRIRKSQSPMNYTCE